MSVAVSPTPKGPPTPTGGWSVAFADGFAVPIGTAAGQDNRWFPNAGDGTNLGNAAGGNSNETQLYNPSQVKVDAEGLQLIGEPKSGLGGNKKFLGGTVTGTASKPPAGTKAFQWKPTEGKTMAFEIVCKYPPNTGECDIGWWSFGPLGFWFDEIDFFEAWGWNASNTATSGWTKTEVGNVWIYRTSEGGGTLQVNTHSVYSFDPTAAFHTYTFVIFPDNSFSAYIDGAVLASCNKVKPASTGSIQRVMMGLVIQYAMREAEGHTSGFTSGQRKFTVRSVAVYEDTPHAGVNTENAGIAVGTTVGGETKTGGVPVGTHLRASQGSWSHSPTGYAYQWERCDAAGGSPTPIAGAVAATYQVVTADKGHTLRCQVTASNAFGSASQISLQTAEVE